MATDEEGRMSWETVIGLEVHVQLRTAEKLFCSDGTAFGEAPNSQRSLILSPDIPM